ncbi:hypothetical protein, partial [Methanocaldococcus sp.]
MPVPMIFKEMCPNCKREIDSYRLTIGVCEKCLKEDVRLEKLELCKKIDVKHLKDYCKVWREFKEFENFVNKLNYKLLSIQKMWA